MMSFPLRHRSLEEPGTHRDTNMRSEAVYNIGTLRTRHRRLRSDPEYSLYERKNISHWCSTATRN